MNSELLQIEWQNRFDALFPCGLIAFDASAISLAEKLLLFEDEKLSTFQGVNSKRMILITGSGENLPWTNGVTYLGRDTKIPSVLLPTTLSPRIPLELFDRLLNENFRQFAPFAALPEKVIPFGKAKALSRRVLENWLSENK